METTNDWHRTMTSEWWIGLQRLYWESRVFTDLHSVVLRGREWGSLHSGKIWGVSRNVDFNLFWRGNGSFWLTEVELRVECIYRFTLSGVERPWDGLTAQWVTRLTFLFRACLDFSDHFKCYWGMSRFFVVLRAWYIYRFTPCGVRMLGVMLNVQRLHCRKISWILYKGKDNKRPILCWEEGVGLTDLC